MIYLFSGTNTKKKRQAYEDFLKSEKGIEPALIDRKDFDASQIESFYSGAGLFSPKSIIVFENVFASDSTRDNMRDFLEEKLPNMGESSNDFIFLEGKLTKPMLDMFKKARADLNVFEEIAKEKKERFNTFMLANALGSKDKLNLWIGFRQALVAGVSLEELAGVLFWKAKDMILKRSYGKFSEAEIKNFSSKISYLLPEARTRGADAEEAFEEFLLEAF
jgi:hypothetical protein